ncbi:SdpI family protein [Microbacterium sp. C7(2022)]|uniref:SdpI family protein n=1 Tax=Microbacterium sp. C7(2022) TaxID=2992759 RepID=UPI00237BD497|nr:SdpI family protein [Microbacterium sp. C7(2022)]MDE0546354.1 SdpI family protein [Microbacterium sp. C7(2022)]
MESEWIARGALLVTMVGAGVLLIWMANAAASGRLKRNHLAGIRVPSTMASEEAWLAAHVRARTATIYAGVISIFGGAIALVPVPMPVVTIGILVAAVITLGFVLYGARVGSAAAKATSQS